MVVARMNGRNGNVLNTSTSTSTGTSINVQKDESSVNHNRADDGIQVSLNHNNSPYVNNTMNISSKQRTLSSPRLSMILSVLSFCLMIVILSYYQLKNSIVLTINFESIAGTTVASGAMPSSSTNAAGKNRYATTTKVPSSSSESSSFIYIPLQPFHACNGQIEKIVCLETYLVLSGGAEILPNVVSYDLSNTMKTNTTNELIDVVCNELLFQLSSFESNSTPTAESSSLFSSYAEVPICIQNGYDGTFGALAYYSSYPATQTGTMREIRLVQEPQQSIAQPNEPNGTAKLVQSYIRTSLFPEISESESISIRRIYRKRVDFPHHYKFISPNDWSIPEPSRDDNYGNMVWRYASHKMINPITINTNLYPSTIRYDVTTPLNDADALILAIANALQLEVHNAKTTTTTAAQQRKIKNFIQTLTKRVTARNISTIVLGLGIQAEFYHLMNDNNDDDLNSATTIPLLLQKIFYENSTMNTNNTKLRLPFPYQTEFLTEVSKRHYYLTSNHSSGDYNNNNKRTIGVRGDVTEAVCRNSNINNCISMGCPSLTISRDTNLGRTIETKWNALLLLLLLHVNQQQQTTASSQSMTMRIALATPGFHLNEGIINIVLELYCTILVRNGYDYSVTIIVQSPSDKIFMKEYIEKVWNKSIINNNNYYYNSIIDGKNQIRFVEYYNVESWLHSAAHDYDLCISARIHGAMPFISAGIPVIVIPTDIRIMELVQAMHLPYILSTTVRLHILGSNRTK